MKKILGSLSFLAGMWLFYFGDQLHKTQMWSSYVSVGVMFLGLVAIGLGVFIFFAPKNLNA